MSKFAVQLLFIATFILGLFLSRLYRLDSFPPSLYWEEVALGYDAYSLMLTGKDHHGNILPLVALESFGDWKPTAYAYAAIPFIRLFGLSDFSIRLVSALAGISIVFGMGVLAFLWEQEETRSRRLFSLWPIALGVSLVSPWLLYFSRAAWEVNLATALILWGVITSLWAIRHKKNELLLVSAVLMIIALYTYHAARVIAPLLGAVMGVWWFFSQKNKVDKRFLITISFACTLAIVALVPFIRLWGSPQLQQRLAETSIFSDTHSIEKSNRLKELSGNAWWSRFLYHRYVLWSLTMTQNALSHFRFDFLFISGDSNSRHSPQVMGHFYLFEAVFLAIGWYTLARTKKSWWLGLWLVIGLIPVSVTLAVPHALRILPIAPVFLLGVSIGMREFLDWTTLLLKQSKLQRKLPKMIVLLPVCSVVILYSGSVLYFWRYYTTIYPALYASDWQYGYKEMIMAVERHQTNEPILPVFITREQGRPAMYYWFYTRTNPLRVQASDSVAAKDQGEYLEFEHIAFINETNQVSQTPSLVAGSPSFIGKLHSEREYNKVTVLSEVTNRSGALVWQVIKIE